MSTTLLVLAAGMGSRFGGLKQIEPVGPNGELIIDYSVYDALRAGFEKVVFVIRPDIETEFRESIGDRYTGRVPVEYVFQDIADLPAGYAVPIGRGKPWGTGQAILAARGVIDEPFAVINADDFYGSGAYGMLHDHLVKPRAIDSVDYAMVGFRLGNTLSDHGGVSRGVCEYDSDGYVSRVTECHGITRDGQEAWFTDSTGERVSIPGDTLVSMNFWGFMPSVFTYLQTAFETFLSMHAAEKKSEFLIPEVVGELVEQGIASLRALQSRDKWLGITNPEDKRLVTEGVRDLIEAGQYPQRLFP